MSVTTVSPCFQILRRLIASPITSLPSPSGVSLFSLRLTKSSSLPKTPSSLRCCYSTTNMAADPVADANMDAVQRRLMFEDERHSVSDHNAKAPIAVEKIDNETNDVGGTSLDDCRGKGHGLQLLEIHDAEPVVLLSQEFHEAKVKASNWVNNNILELGNMYGALFEGCEKEALALLIELDGRNMSLEKQREGN
ncbi:hypothetical protein FXO38_02565 [Capsicum annuum]|nr:hypothetical protein FXO38_02565 [Capsicum annuum]KAF3682007.1 hypothetical protein FXO37_02589 [Capsicum annuum]